MCTKPLQIDFKYIFWRIKNTIVNYDQKEHASANFNSLDHIEAEKLISGGSGTLLMCTTPLSTHFGCIFWRFENAIDSDFQNLLTGAKFKSLSLLEAEKLILKSGQNLAS